jgi:hypothetical protein
VVAINTIPWGSLEVWKEFWKSKGAGDVIWATDTEQNLVPMFQVVSLGATIIIDRQGNISHRDDGATPYDTLRNKVEEVL